MDGMWTMLLRLRLVCLVTLCALTGVLHADVDVNLPGATPAAASTARVATEPAAAPSVVTPPVASPTQPTFPVAAAGPTANGMADVVIRCAEAIEVNLPFLCELLITARTDLRNVVIDQPVPEGLEVIGSSPVAVWRGAFIEWRIPSMSRGETQRILVKFNSKTARPVTLCANVAAECYVCANAKVVQPRIAITKTGPATAILGGNVSYTIVVRNDGDGTARDVVVKDTIPAELQHVDRVPELSFRLGDLAPGQEKMLTVPLVAINSGRALNRARVETSNAGAADASAPTEILRQGLNVTKSGPRMQFFNKRAQYAINVENTGDTVLHDVVVVDRFPAATRLVSAPSARIEGNTVTWTIPTMAPRTRQAFTVYLTSSTAGTHRNTVEVASREGLRKAAAADTLWKGQAALLIEVVDVEDPIMVNDEETYTISVKNQGTEVDQNVRLVATLSPELVPTSASGATRGTVSGQTVTFAPCAVLPAREVITYTVKARAVRTGDARFKVQMTSALLTTPVTEEESTQVY